MPLLRNRPDDLRALIGATAEVRGIDAIFVEKDFWVTEVLRAATAPIQLEARDGSNHPVNTIFKGGTSLSRVYGLIERFSEDVDLLVGFPDVDASVGAKDRVLKAIRDAVTTHLRLGTGMVVSEASTTGVKRNTRYYYSGLGYATVGAISAGILLEMGCRGGTFPTCTHMLKSMVAEHAIEGLGDSPDTWDEFAPVALEVLAPERTLLEKLALLHHAAVNATDDDGRARLARSGRHIYDVHMLLGSEIVIAALNQAGADGIATLCADIDVHSSSAGFPSTPRPAGGYGESPLIAADPPFLAALADGYSAAMDLVFGDRPSLEECLDTIRAQRSLV